MFVYQRYKCEVIFYRGRKELGTYFIYGTWGEIECLIRGTRRKLGAGWWAIQKLELATNLLSYKMTNPIPVQPFGFVEEIKTKKGGD